MVGGVISFLIAVISFYYFSFLLYGLFIGSRKPKYSMYPENQDSVNFTLDHSPVAIRWITRLN